MPIAELARAYHDRGINVIPLGRDKRPIAKWKRWQTEQQSPVSVQRMPFRNATGVAGICGAVSAPEGAVLACIDADAAPGRAPLDSLLGNLGLPRDYAWAVRTPGKGGGWHVWIIVVGLAAELAKKGLSAGNLWSPFPGSDHIELCWNNGYAILPGSSHPGGGFYRWEHGNGTPPTQLPAVVDAGRVVRLGKWKGEATDGKRAPAAPLDDKIAEGDGRHKALASYAGSMRRRGASEEAMLAALRVENKEKCAVPISEGDLAHIASSMMRYAPTEPLNKMVVPAPAGEEAAELGNSEFPKATEAVPGNSAPLIHEAAHAEVLAAAWRDEYRWAPHEGTWRRWTGRVWEAAADPVVVAAAQKVLRQHYGLRLAEKQTDAEDKRLRGLHGEACRFSSVQGALAFLKGEQGFHTAFDEWDAAPYALNCADGILDLRSQTLRRHDPAELCTKVTRWKYADEASTGAWARHLERCLPDADVRRQVQRDLGRALVGANLEMSLPIWYGLGRNGKSTTADAVIEGLDGYAKTAVANLLILQRFEQHSTDLADLAGSRLAICEEIEDGKRLNEARVKRLTGGKTESARFMRCDNFRFRPPTIFLLVNHHPVITGTDKGIWGRLRLVPWTVSIPFPEQRPEEEMLAELAADGAWMLRWMVAGFADWQRDHHWIADEVRVATEEYRVEQDRLAGFLARQCDLRPHGTVEVGELFGVYERDAKEVDEVPMSKIAFGKQLRNQGFRQDSRRRVWQGIRLAGVQSFDLEDDHCDKE